MKIKVSEATPKQIDWMVAKCEDVLFPRSVPKYSTDWAQGGPIIEREDIATEPATMLGQCAAFAWDATIYAADSDAWSTYGPTPLIAAMRCYVVSKLGEEVEIPDELMEG